jgi:cellulose synthase/poly-beta-1,6-N-acetylglucosamine synthase-like glycosyltransferase
MFGGALCYSGAFTMFNTHIVIEAGGHDVGNFAHDAEITLKVHQYMRDHNRPYRVSYDPSAIAWTEVPGTFKSFWIQRGKWQRGLLRSFFLHKKFFLFYRYGQVGYISYPFYIAFEVFAPVVEFTAYMTAVLGFFYGIESHAVLIFIAVAWAYFAFLRMSTVLLSLLTFNVYRHKLDVLRIFLFVFLNPFGFRQFMVLSYVRGTVQYFWNRLRGRKL